MREWISGRNPVYEVLRAGRRQAFRLQIAQGAHEKGRLDEIVRICRQRNLPVEHVPRGQLDARSPNNQGVALEVSGYPYSDLTDMLAHAEKRGEPPLILVLDAMQDPQNLGTLLRTAEIVGVHGVLLPLRHTVTVTPAVVHASSGASEHLLIAQSNLAQALESLKREDVWVVGLEGTTGSIARPGPAGWAVGAGGGQQGRHALWCSCDLLILLPCSQIRSLSAASPVGSPLLCLAGCG
jgi:23S rRNA (guanosine2251-2'-O)-methyltransferase